MFGELPFLQHLGRLPLEILMKSVILLAWVLLLVFFWKKKTASAALFLIITIGALSVIVESLPLARVYSLRPVFDRSAYLAIAKSISVGNPFYNDYAFKDIPAALPYVFPLILTVIHWITKISIFVLYQYSPLMPCIFMPLIFYWIWNKNQEDRWESILVVFVVMFLTSDLDMFISSFKATVWTDWILGKATHTLAIMSILPLYYLVSRKKFLESVIFGGLLLGFMVYAFLEAAGFVMAILLIYPFVSYFANKDNLLKNLSKVILIIIFAVILSSPYWLRPMVLYGYSTQEVPGNENPTQNYYIPGARWSTVIDPFESTFMMGGIFYLGLIGIWIMLNRRKRLDIFIISSIIGLYLLKFIFIFSHEVFHFAPKAGEIPAYIRLFMGISSAVALSRIFDIILNNRKRISEILNHQYVLSILPDRINSIMQNTIKDKWRLVLIAFIFFTPILPPIYRFPSVMDYKWNMAREPVPLVYKKLSEWIERSTKKDAVFVCSDSTADWVISLTGRKVLLPSRNKNPFVNYLERQGARDRLFTSRNLSEIEEILKKFEISYLVVDDDIIARYPGLSLTRLTDNFGFQIVFKFFADVQPTASYMPAWVKKEVSSKQIIVLSKK